jgi:TonB family protein
MRVAELNIAIALALLPACATAPPRATGPSGVPHPRPPTMPVAQLLECLSSLDSATRAACAWQLAQLANPQQDVVAALENHRADPDRSVRYAVAWALGHQRRAGEEQAVSGVQQQTPPRPKRITRPRYPDAAYRAKVEGTVVLAILVGEDGEVAYAEVIQSVPALDDAALACVRQWEFVPMRVGGEPRATIAHAPVAFRIY